MNFNPCKSWRLVIEDRPLRCEPFGIDRLDQLAKSLAEQLTVEAGPSRNRKFFHRIKENARVLRQTHQIVSAQIRAGEVLEPDAEWLLDNFYIVEEQLREIRDDLPAGFLKELPHVRDGRPRVQALAMELICHTDSVLDGETLVRFVTQFQLAAPLTIGELWAFPIMLRLVLVENLRRIAKQLLTSLACREEAIRILKNWQDHGEASLDLSPLDECAGVVLHLLESLQSEGEVQAARLSDLERRIATLGTTANQLIHDEHQRRAGNQVLIGNVITSMRLISALDWSVFFERTSLVDEVLRQDPLAVYEQMDTESRDRYRHVVERISKGSSLSEVEVAQVVLQLAREQVTKRQQHVGYWLVDEGLSRTEAICRYRPSIIHRIRRCLQRFPLFAYAGSISLITAIFLSSESLFLAASGIDASWIVILGLLFIWPASELGVGISNLIFTSVLPPKLLPKLELAQGIPAGFRTIVVVPSMLTHAAEVTALLDRLEMHYLAGPDPNLRFALLTDFSDAPQQDMPSDSALLQQATKGVEALNHKYQVPGYAPFYLFHRRRLWNSREGVWMGWERKRGKLLEFHQLLQGSLTEVDPMRWTNFTLG